MTGTKPNLGGGVKAALMLLCIGKPVAAKLIGKLSFDEVRAVVASASLLNNVSRAEIDEMIDSFSELYGQGVKFLGTEQEVMALLSEVIPEEMAAKLEADGALPATAAASEEVERSVWDRLQSVSTTRIADLLNNEQVQTSAAILNAMDREQASSVISLLNKQHRSEILRRMLVLQPLSRMAMELLEEIARTELLSDDGSAGKTLKRKEIAGIINAMSGDDAKTVIDELSSSEPEEAVELSKFLFSFADIEKLDEDNRAALLGTVDAEKLTTALHGSSAEFQQLLLSSLSARSRRMIEGELQSVTPKDDAVAAAQREIAKTALALAADGTISLPVREQVA
jgi:flagellar motor switch protein FliG